MARYHDLKHKLLALLLAACSITSVAAFSACNQDDDTTPDDDPSTESTETKTDDSRISNGSFEFFTESDTTLIVASVNDWANAAHVATSGTASPSQVTSGIVNTETAAWNNLTKPSGLSFATEDDAAANWDNLSANDKLKFIETWQADENNDDRSLSDLSFYDAKTDAFNIDYEDAPTCENPLTHYAATDTKAAKNQNVLMIHNVYDNRGTAQKYTASSAITLAAGTAAELSMWVKTSDLTYADNATGETQDVVGLRGAYIGITQQIGSVTLDPLYVKNIDTEALNPTGADNGWVKYTFYLNGSSYSETTFKISLGLGMSGGTNRMEYVSGYAFFDDVVCTTMRSEEFDQKVTDAGISGSVIGLSATEDDKIFRADTSSKEVFNYAIDLDKSVNTFSDYTVGSVNTSITAQKSGADGKEYVSAYDPNNPDAIVYQPLGFETTNDENGLFANRAEIAASDPNNPYLAAFLNNSFKTDSIFKDKQTLLLLSADGAAYTAKFPTVTVPGFDESNPNQNRMVLSFFVKTSDMKGKTGVTITLYDVNNQSNSATLSSIDTSAAEKINVDSADGNDEDEDIYEGWQQCFFFVENPTTAAKTFAITVNLGPKDVVGKARTDFYPGYAAFTAFQYRTISKTEYSYATDSTYTATISLEDEKTDGDPSSFNSETSIGKNIEETLADAADYRGVYGGSAYVSRTGTDKRINDYAYAGLMNSDYIDEYLTQAAGDADYWLNKLNASPNKAFLEGLFGDASQPLVIYNDGVDSYGYLGEKKTISTGGSVAISVRVKVAGNAKAYIYLSDMDDVDLEETLSVGRKISYWYDSKGNVCDKDPKADDFSSKNNVAFKLQPNGLYKVNPQWSKANTVDANAYFANYANYETDENQNKVVAEGGVSYDYTTKWRNDGNDGIAFYYKDGAYYAESSYTTRVYDFSTVVDLPARHSVAAAKSLVATVENTAGEWKTVTFYLKAGVSEKNYRLEVWSGSRDGSVVNEAGSYVLFDHNSYGDFTNETYSNLLTYALDDLLENYDDEDDFKANYAGVLYDTFSFYDNARFLRYDETADEKEVGNSYPNYDSTVFTETVAYLLYENGNETVVFADFDAADKEVTPVSKDDDTPTDEDPETPPADDQNQTNVWLLVSSLVISAALLFAIGSIIVRKIVKNVRKNKAARVKTEKDGDDKATKRPFSMRNAKAKKSDSDKKDEE